MKTIKNTLTLILLLLTITFINTSCSSDDNHTDENEQQQTYLKATVNGEEYIGRIEDFNTDNETYFYIYSVSEDGKNIVQINCNFAPSIGSFELSQFVNSLLFLYSDTVQDGGNTTRVYQTGIYQDNFGDGSLTISEYQTDIYNTALKGSFSFTAPCSGSTCGEEGVLETSNITNGSFFVKLN